jgi:hypothetical protein
MARTHLKTVSIGTIDDLTRLSPGQKTFNTLIKQIDQARVRLAAWEAVQTPYQQKYATVLQPLFRESEELQVKTVHALDNAGAQIGLSKAERRKIAAVIIEMVQDLLLSRDDEALKAIFNKYSAVDYDEMEAGGQAGLKSAIESMLGVELDDDIDLRSREDILQQAHAKMLERQAQEDADRQAWQERQTRRKKSAKQLAKEAQEQADKQQLRLSIREIYRKLASALHPDREPDPQERERKTALMQRVNQAYDKNNLLQLLELQLEIEQIDQAAINHVSEDRLKHYNKILREQLLELQQEILRIESVFVAQAMLDPYSPVSPKTVMKALAAEIANVQRDIRELKKDLFAFEDLQGLKGWLKTLRKQSRRDAFYDIPF